MAEIEGKSAFSQVENANAGLDMKGGVGDFRAEAIAAEDLEHNMGLASHRRVELAAL